MRLLYLSLLLSLNLSFGAWGQNTTAIIKRGALIKGLIVDEASNAPLAYATISLFSQQDSSLITGALTDDSGAFSLKAPVGNYYALAEFLSYQSKSILDIVVLKKSKQIDLGMIGLSVNSTVLEEVEVRAEKSDFSLTLDKKIFTVGKDLTAGGGDATEILNNVPTVQFSPEGGVRLRGSEGVKIWIDGRPSPIMALNAEQGLKSIPADMIDKVELITNPSARYDAESVSGIINIVLKKQRSQGVNGSVNIFTGFPETYGGGVNINLRKNKWNFFTNLNYRFAKIPREGVLYQERLIRDTFYASDQNSNFNFTDNTFNFRGGLDFFINDKNTISSQVSILSEESLVFTQMNYDDFILEGNIPLGFSFRTTNRDIIRQNFEYNFTYNRKFSKKGEELILDIQFVKSNLDDLGQMFESPSIIDRRFESFTQFSNNQSEELRLVTQLDYVLPLGQSGKLEAGGRVSLRDIDNSFTVDELINGQNVRLDEVSNDFNYEENIYAAYLLFGSDEGKFSYQLGLRTEVSDVKTLLLKGENDFLQFGDSLNDRTYVNLFPSASLTYRVSDAHAIQMSYSRRLKRPSFRDLVPFISYSDRRNLSAGNPNLDPEYANSLEFSYIRYWEKATLTSAVFYRRAVQYIERLRFLTDAGVFQARPQNLGFQNAYGFEFSYSWQLLKEWRISGDVNFYYAELDGGSFGDEFNAEAFSSFGRITSLYTLKSKLRFQLRFNFRAPRNASQGFNQGRYWLDGAISYPVLKNKGSLALSGRNILNTDKWRWNNQGANFFNRGTYIYVVPSVRLAFTYQINKKIRRKQVGNKSSAEYRDGGY